MAIVEYNSTIIKEMHTWLRHALSTNLAVKLLESLIVLIIALIFLRIVKSLLANLDLQWGDPRGWGGLISILLCLFLL